MAEETKLVDWALIEVFLDDCDDWLSQAAVQLLAVQSDPNNQEAIQSLFRAYHSIKGTCEFFPCLDDVKQLAHVMEDLLSAWREQTLKVSDAAIETLLKATDLITELVSPLHEQQLPTLGAHDAIRLPLMRRLSELYSPNVMIGGPLWKHLRASVSHLRTAVDDAAIGALVDDLLATIEKANATTLTPDEKSASSSSKNTATDVTNEASDNDEANAPTRSTNGNKKASRAQGKARTMRIAEAKLDEFLKYVGEFVTLREIFTHFGERLHNVDGAERLCAEYSRTLGTLSTLTLELQKSVMEVRKVPLKGLLERAPRIAHDVAVSTNKKLSTIITGSELMIDKSLLEQLEAPLTHILRNAVDHGIEEPVVRLRTGKSEAGTLTITASESEKYLSISIRDDGAGISSQALLDKAISKGLTTPANAVKMNEKERCQLLFLPGLSTAESVTAISGRGVGMDVVAKNIKELGGTIEIETEVGKGTCFSLRIPTSVTVNIVDAFVVELGNQQYVLPLMNVGESFVLNEDDVFTGPGAEQMLVRENQVLFLVDLSKALDVKASPRNERVVVAMEFPEGRNVGLVVDAVVGVQNLVLRDVDGLDELRTPFFGGAILGNGQVALALDLERFAEGLHHHRPMLDSGPQQQATR